MCVYAKHTFYVLAKGGVESNGTALCLVDEAFSGVEKVLCAHFYEEK